MIPYNVPINAQRMTIGVQGENNVREFLFDVTEWRQLTGDIGTAEMVIQRRGDTSPYAAAITMHDENTVSWVPTSADTAKAGAGKIQLMWIANGQTVKTKIFDMKVDPALDYQLPDDSLDPWASWVPDVINAAAAIGDLPGTVADATADWLEDNIEPTAPAVDASLSVSGAAADAKVVGDKFLKNNDTLYDYNSVNLLPLFATYTDGPTGGVTYTWSSDHKSCTAVGTASSASFRRLYYSVSELPTGILPGGKYLLRVSTTSNDFYVSIYFYDSNGEQLPGGGGYRSDFTITVPSDAVGMLFRVTVPTGATVNDTLTLDGFLTAYSNEELKNQIDSLDSDIESIQSLGLLDIVNSSQLPNNTDADTLVGMNKMYLISSPGTYYNIPWDTSSSAGMIATFFVRNATLQVAYSYVGSAIWTRRYNHNTSNFSTWTSLNPTEVMNVNHNRYLPSMDLNDLNSVNETWLLNSPTVYENAPFSQSYAGMLSVYSIKNITVQIALQFNGNLYFRYLFNSIWRPWKLVSGGEGGGGITVEQIINQYSDTYTINCEPQITTDTNNYLASTGTTDDVSASIVSMLETTGVCHLGPGVFWVSGVDMPDGSAVIGSGPATKVYLLGSGDGYAFACGNKCTVKDMTIYGQADSETYGDYSSPGSPVWSGTASVVQRHGILISGTYSPPSTTGNLKGRVQLSNLYIANFAGGGITHYGTGPNVAQGVEAVNVYIWHCYAGVYIPFWAEFGSYTNIKSVHCHYGAIVNGGNQWFVNSQFLSNYVNLWMDDSLGLSPNNSHASFSSCAFAHAYPNNAGVNILLQSIDFGEVFSACDIFYGSVMIENCSGITFSGCEFGTSIPVEISGEKLALFGNCIFRSRPSISISENNSVKTNGCYLTDGTEFVI